MKVILYALSDTLRVVDMVCIDIKYVCIVIKLRENNANPNG